MSALPSRQLQSREHCSLWPSGPNLRPTPEHLPRSTTRHQRTHSWQQRHSVPRHPSSGSGVVRVTAYVVHMTLDVETGGQDVVCATDQWSGDQTLWLSDSGATVHISNDRRMFHPHLTDTERIISVADGSVIWCSGIQDVHLVSNNGTTVMLVDCLYVPEFNKSIISSGKLTQEGNSIVITENEITISSEGHSQELKFEKRSGLYYLQAGLANQANMVAGPDRVPVNINDAHLILGHVGETLLRKTALHIGWRMNGQLNPCPSCMLCKSTAKRVRQDTIIKASKPGERIFLNITGPLRRPKTATSTGHR
jgi:hypothetical protein